MMHAHSSDQEEEAKVQVKQHSKVAAKTGGAVYQWEIMRAMVRQRFHLPPHAHSSLCIYVYLHIGMQVC